MKNFKHTEKLKELCCEHPIPRPLSRSYHVTIFTLWDVYASLHPSLTLIFGAFQSKLQASAHLLLRTLTHIVPSRHLMLGVLGFHGREPRSLRTTLWGRHGPTFSSLSPVCSASSQTMGVRWMRIRWPSWQGVTELRHEPHLLTEPQTLHSLLYHAASLLFLHIVYPLTAHLSGKRTPPCGPSAPLIRSFPDPTLPWLNEVPGSALLAFLP